MKSILTFIMIFALFIIGAVSKAQQIINYTPIIPLNIKAISNSKSLQPFIFSNNSDTSIGACLRFGEIGNQKDIPILIEIFNKRPYNTGIDTGPDLKYYILLSIGKIGGPTAEEYLKTTVRAISNKINPYEHSFTRSDSLITVGAACNGLSEIGSRSARAFLDSVFHNNGYISVIRSKAQMAILNIDLKNREFRVADDTALFLIEKWKEVPWAEHEYISPGVVDSNFLIRRNIESLLFKYRSYTLPYIGDLINKSNIGAPKITVLHQLKKQMEQNPPLPEH
jgi:hypothetical protein